MTPDKETQEFLRVLKEIEECKLLHEAQDRLGDDVEELR